MLKDGAFDIGGICAVNPSGGLIAMGHPIGPTGIGQIGESPCNCVGKPALGRSLMRDVRTGMAHMVGIGAVCYVRVLQR